jgi:hypothetical protein
MKKPNYQFQKRQKEMKQKAKQEQKRLRKLEKSNQTDVTGEQAMAPAQPPADASLPEEVQPSDGNEVA